MKMNKCKLTPTMNLLAGADEDKSSRRHSSPSSCSKRKASNVIGQRIKRSYGNRRCMNNRRILFKGIVCFAMIVGARSAAEVAQDHASVIVDVPDLSMEEFQKTEHYEAWEDYFRTAEEKANGGFLRTDLMDGTNETSVEARKEPTNLGLPLGRFEAAWAKPAKAKTPDKREIRIRRSDVQNIMTLIGRNNTGIAGSFIGANGEFKIDKYAEKLIKEVKKVKGGALGFQEFIYKDEQKKNFNDTASGTFRLAKELAREILNWSLDRGLNAGNLLFQADDERKVRLHTIRIQEMHKKFDKKDDSGEGGLAWHFDNEDTGEYANIVLLLSDPKEFNGGEHEYISENKIFVAPIKNQWDGTALASNIWHRVKDLQQPVVKSDQGMKTPEAKRTVMIITFFMDKWYEQEE